MKNILNKIKNNELLNYYDLEKIAKEVRREKGMLYSVEYSDSPTYDFVSDIVGISNNSSSDWFCGDTSEMYMRKYIKPHINKNEILEARTLNPKEINLLLLNSVMHEIRHAEQQKILKSNEIKDLEFTKNMLLSNVNRGYLKNYLYHDYLYHEYDADFQGGLMLNDLNERFFELDEINYYNQYLAYKILRAYTDKNLREKSYPIKNNQKINGNIEEIYTIGWFLKNFIKLSTDNSLPKEYHELNQLIKTIEFRNEKNDFNSRLLRGDELTKLELEEIKQIYLGNKEAKKIIIK